MKPTIGRAVHVYGGPLPGMNKNDVEPVAGTVCAVNSDGRVTVAGFDHLGVPFSVRDIEFVQDEGGGLPEYPTPYATWPARDIPQTGNDPAK